MLKDQLIAFALLIPFLKGIVADPKKPVTQVKQGAAQQVALDPPIAAKADDKRPPVVDPNKVTVPPKKEVDPAASIQSSAKSVAGGFAMAGWSARSAPKKASVDLAGVQNLAKVVSGSLASASWSAVAVPKVVVGPKFELAAILGSARLVGTGIATAGMSAMVVPKAATQKPAEQKPVEQTATKGPVLPPTYDEITIGSGQKVAAGERAVFHFSVADAQGKELVNSKKRGLPFTVENGAGDQLWDSILKDMKVGGVRKMALAAEQVNSGKGLPPYVPPGVPVTVTVWLLKAEKR